MRGTKKLQRAGMELADDIHNSKGYASGPDGTVKLKEEWPKKEAIVVAAEGFVDGSDYKWREPTASGSSSSKSISAGGSGSSAGRSKG